VATLKQFWRVRPFIGSDVAGPVLGLTRLPLHVYELPVTVFDSDAAAAWRAGREAEIAAIVHRIGIKSLDLGALANRYGSADRHGGGHE
jgi:hypothetical protein